MEKTQLALLYIFLPVHRKIVHMQKEKVWKNANKPVI